MQLKLEPHCLDDPTTESFVIPGAKVFDRYFDCPLDYSNTNSLETIKVFVRHLVPINKVKDIKTLPFLLYLQGGPGFEVASPSTALSGWIKVAFEQGFQVLLLDQRGTGLSTPVSATSLEKFPTDDDKVNYLTHFRADSIVRDCETIRLALTKDRVSTESQRISLLGQSFGGFCITTYLSLFPQSIHKAYITGGVPPLVDNPDTVYRSLYPRILKKNKLYYKKFPQDVVKVRRIHEFLWQNNVTLPNGGKLSPRRFLQLGILFGGSGGYDTLHETVTFCINDLDNINKLSYRTLNHIQQLQSWDTNVIYCILHEAIYCQNQQSSRWSAERVMKEEQFASDFEWRLDRLQPDQAVNFTGETIYPFMLDDFSELRPLATVAHKLAEYKWKDLYHIPTLNTLDSDDGKMELAGVSYFDDMYVDRDHSEYTASQINGFQQYITNQYAHNGLHVDSENVLNYLIKLGRGDVAYDR
ncbi:Alpha/Beta hydrolase protein [Halteromyces radiatus]|uniref:Alpha/Beta hydrolase protein n=1 Tax=Halteromyces radiatus TaxID=101107 RepID=UPI00221ECB08|nr:Alpha/Beta hydrolase protein [Halteromyces radiatus]KAI8098772.1 Alpha/Beta hydrolase protein [Halteromyces radiatus]